MNSQDDVQAIIDKRKAKAAAFKKLGNTRLGKALDAIENLLPLSNTNTYEYVDEQAEVIVGELQAAVNEVQAAFENGGPRKQQREFL